MKNDRQLLFIALFLVAGIIAAAFILISAVDAQEHTNECDIGGRMEGLCDDDEDLWRWGYYLHRQLYYNEAFPAGWTRPLQQSVPSIPGYNQGPVIYERPIIPPQPWPPFFPYCPANPCGVCNNLAYPPDAESCVQSRPDWLWIPA